MKKETSIKAVKPETRQNACDVGWVIVDAYLDGLEASAPELFGDREYKRIFDEMRHYTDLQLYGGDEFNMDDLEVVIYRDKNGAK